MPILNKRAEWSRLYREGARGIQRSSRLCFLAVKALPQGREGNTKTFAALFPRGQGFTARPRRKGTITPIAVMRNALEFPQQIACAPPPRNVFYENAFYDEIVDVP